MKNLKKNQVVYALFVENKKHMSKYEIKEGVFLGKVNNVQVSEYNKIVKTIEGRFYMNEQDIFPTFRKAQTYLGLFLIN